MRLLSRSTLAVGLVCFGALGSSLGGCIIEDDSSSRGSTAPAPTSTAPSPSPTSSAPPLLPIDTSRTLTAKAGDGAGIFVTYDTGGHWSLQWTCDTNASGYGCAFDVSVSASAISNYLPVPQNATVAQDATSFRARTTTAATLDGATFDTPPGAPIVLSATINGNPMPSLVFYVSNGKLSTAPTDPVEFVPTTP